MSAEASRRWREQNPEQVAAYNAARRVEHATKTCPYCGDAYVVARRDQFACSKPACQVERERSRKREAYARRGPRSRRA